MVSVHVQLVRFYLPWKCSLLDSNAGQSFLNVDSQVVRSLWHLKSPETRSKNTKLQASWSVLVLQLFLLDATFHNLHKVAYMGGNCHTSDENFKSSALIWQGESHIERLTRGSYRSNGISIVPLSLSSAFLTASQTMTASSPSFPVQLGSSSLLTTRTK